MCPYDPPESYSATSYNWKAVSHKPKTGRALKILNRVVLALLVFAVLGLLYVNWKEAQIIALQRHLIIQMWQYIQMGCPSPTSALN